MSYILWALAHVAGLNEQNKYLLTTRVELDGQNNPNPDSL